MKPDTKPGVWQCAAVLILCRAFLFFCNDLPYTAAHAAGTAAAFLLAAGLLLPLLPRRSGTEIPAKAEPLLRVLALLWAARLLASLYTLLEQLSAPRPLFTAALTVILLTDLIRLPRAAERAAVLMLFVLAAAFLLLPLRTLKTADPVFLSLPGDSTAAFRRGISGMAELTLLPLLLHKHDAAAAGRGILAWLIAGGILIPGVILVGTMQNGRLLQWRGNPFFLLLARTPLSDAVRTDGLWIVLAAGCGLLTLTLFLRTAAVPLRTGRQTVLSPRTAFRAAVLLTASAAFFYLMPAAAEISGAVSSGMTVLLLWYAAIRRKDKQTAPDCA